MKATLILAFLGLLALVAGDCYMHNPRGSNNRLNEANTNRDNNNRLFDSQNNAKGGYCWGPSMTYYEGSQLTIEWATQHGCNNGKQQCSVIIQYMCGSKNEPDQMNQIRDGATTNALPYNPANPQAIEALTSTITGNYTYGMHENFWYYNWCRTRQRNQGLYTADRNLATNVGAAATRQNNNGGQSGYECPEERDYYPYWHPNPWKDIAVLTDDLSLCGLFQGQSQNVNGKGYCYDPTDPTESTFYNWVSQNNPTDCAAAGLTWNSAPSWGFGKPDCIQSPFIRDNHLGNTANGFNAIYNWTLPTRKQEGCIGSDDCDCVLRIRYNISTFDFSGYYVPFLDAHSNGAAAPLKQNPDLPQGDVNCSALDQSQVGDCFVTLAVDTSQFARTFQDRSFVFHISPRPGGLLGSNRIYNLNVKGKRGNIVQAYPGTEYDFHPNDLKVRIGDYIHFQWTGCDKNPAGNAGQGTDQTDRSNIVQVSSLSQSVPATASFLSKHALFQHADDRHYMAFLGQTNCKSYNDVQASNNKDQDTQNCMNLNAADQYFNGGLHKMNKTGSFYYMSSRNNNFTNRGQKGIIIVDPILPVWGVVLVSIGSAIFALSMGTGVAMYYAKSHPHSQIANWLGKL